MSAPSPLTIAISSCLCGEAVRYDGKSKGVPLITGRLATLVELRPICPEVAIGLPVPRPPVELVQRDGGIHAVGVSDPGIDITRPLRQLVRSLDEQLVGVCGYIWKSRSPSCGLGTTHIKSPHGGSTVGNGLFVTAIAERYPLLPMIDELSLQLPEPRSNFIEQLLFYRDSRPLLHRPAAITPLRQLYGDFRLRLMSHRLNESLQLGKALVAHRGRLTRREQLGYLMQIQQILGKARGVKGHAAVLKRLLGTIEKGLSHWERNALQQAINDYRKGARSLDEVKGLLRHYLERERCNHDWRDGYLNREPIEVALA